MTDKVIDRKAEDSCLGDELIDERAQFALMNASLDGFELTGADERTDATTSLEDAGAFELGIDLCDGIGIDSEIDGQLSNRWKLISDAQLPGSDGKSDRAFQLRVERHRVPGVNLEHRRHCTIVIVQCDNDVNAADKSVPSSLRKLRGL